MTSDKLTRSQRRQLDQLLQKSGAGSRPSTTNSLPLTKMQQGGNKRKRREEDKEKKTLSPKRHLQTEEFKKPVATPSAIDTKAPREAKPIQLDTFLRLCQASGGSIYNANMALNGATTSSFDDISDEDLTPFPPDDSLQAAAFYGVCVNPIGPVPFQPSPDLSSSGSEFMLRPETRKWFQRQLYGFTFSPPRERIRTIVHVGGLYSSAIGPNKPRYPYQFKADKLELHQALAQHFTIETTRPVVDVPGASYRYMSEGKSGYAFLMYPTREAAEAAVKQFHDKRIHQPWTATERLYVVTVRIKETRKSRPSSSSTQSVSSSRTSPRRYNHRYEDRPSIRHRKYHSSRASSRDHSRHSCESSRSRYRRTYDDF